MLDLGFMPAIRKIMASLPENRQTVLMSATMPKPIRALAREFQTDPAEISVAPAARPIEQIAQSVRMTPAAEKRQVLAEILAGEDVSRAIVFTRTKRGADRVARHLDDAGLRSAVIHGNKSQSQRARALAGFRAGKTNILVATDIAARGIDIDDVSHVVNFELPNVAEAYVHRIGRTARAGRDGTAISLCDPTELGLLRDIERLIGSRIDGSQTALAAAPDAGADRDPAPRRGDRPAKHRRFKSGKPKSGQSKFGQGKSRDANSGEANSGEAKRARSKSGYPKSGQPKSRRGKAGPPRRRPGAAQPQARAA
jgi:ATP-dependent RNA helicase RhlE